ncbi:TRAP transporter small permease [Melaminivora suipulveris]|uniref:TRAP transporter small permease protein n=1 Tax=Melaminivora suipulveris TaxID=2109913 RepID=A0A2R3Q9C7_9BURK|nr:TRAP transporter small permease [Melaminivora suipulveris]AVO48378.1 TRAP transporter small permease [Melaminivora suipulveris]
MTPATESAPLWYRRLGRVVDAIDNVLVTIGCLLLFALMCLVVADVGRRYLFNAPIAWSYEVVNHFLMPGVFFYTVSHTLKAHAHVAVDILHNYVGTRTLYVFELIGTVLALPVFALVTWLAAGRTLEEWRSAAEASSGLAAPTWAISIVLPLGFGMLTLRLALNAVGYGLSLASGRPVKPLPPISGTEEGAP